MLVVIGIRHPASGIRHPASGIRHPACRSVLLPREPALDALWDMRAALRSI